MDNNKLVYTTTATTTTTTIKHHHHQQQQHHQQHQPEQEALSGHKDNHESFCQPPRVTVSLPKHAATRLRDLVQKRDVALLRLGIISVQFEDDQTIMLTVNSNSNATTTNSNPPKQQLPQPQSLTVPSTDSFIGTTLNSRNTTNCNDPSDAPSTGISSLHHHDPILEGDDEKMESNLDTSTLPVADATTTTTTSSTTTPTSSLPRTSIAKRDCNSSNNLVVYVEEGQDDKDEDEVVIEVENQHSSYNIHQLSQLEFADPIELDMYDNDNLLFPDYTLNLR